MRGFSFVFLIMVITVSFASISYKYILFKYCDALDKKRRKMEFYSTAIISAMLIVAIFLLYLMSLFIII